MRYRIAMWAGAGCLVVGFWALYRNWKCCEGINSTDPIAWTLAQLTCPIVFASFKFHFPIGVYWVLIANAATYALVGLIVETLRRQLRHAN
jgi:hypothetical protein